MQNEAPKQALDRNAGYRAKWMGLTQSKLYLAFVISFMVWVASIGVGCVGTMLIWGLKKTEAVNSLGMLMTALAGASSVIAVMAALSVALWMIRSNDEKKQHLGLGITFWFYVGTLIAAILAFLVTLPMFTEWLPYKESYSQPLQIAYVFYIVLGVDCAMSLAVVQKMRENLGSYEGSCGPVTGMIVMLILRVAAVLLLALLMHSKDALLAMLGIVSMAPVVLLILMLFRYRDAVSKLKY